MNIIRNYILVDDDPFNNIISRIEIENILVDVDIKTFGIPEEALAFIPDEYGNSSKTTILFLDINMPTLTGWEFMEEYEKFSDAIKNQISIYILSSSVDPRDKDKAKANKHIKGYISKPLQGEVVLSLAKVMI